MAFNFRNTFIFRISYLVFGRNSYLNKTGWSKSAFKNASIDNKYQPIPWISYAMLNFLEKKISQEMTVLEYGSGNSTFWLMNKVDQLVSIESDKKWHVKVSEKINKNVAYYLCEPEFEDTYAVLAFLDSDKETNYSKKATELNKKFNVIIIDGIDRKNCIRNTIDLLTIDGVFIIDNTNDLYDKEWGNSLDELINLGFKRLDFCSMCSITPIYTCTSIFYKPNNCFKI